MKRLIYIMALLGLCSTGLHAINISGRVSVIRPERIEIKDIERRLIVAIDIPLAGEITPVEVSLEPDLYIIAIGGNEDFVYIDSDLKFGGFLDSRDMGLSQLTVEGLESHDRFQHFRSLFKPEVGQEAKILARLVREEGMDPRMLPGFVYLRKMDSYEKYCTVYDMLPADFGGVTKRWLERQLDSLYVYREGTPVPTVKGTDRDGREVSIEDLRGSYVLLDFWASWCGPCRNEIRNIKTFYEKYAARGIRFLSVSMDENADKWLAAEDEEQIPWISVRAEGGFHDSPYLSAFGFKTIPFVILVGKDGTVIARQLRGKEIEEKLDEVLAAERNP